MRDKLRVLGVELLNSNLTIGTVEHCTSGLLGASISSMCGLDTVYCGTIVVVDQPHMEKLLDVSPTEDFNEETHNIVWVCIATMTDKKVDFKYSKIQVDGLRGQNIETVIESALDTLIVEVKRITAEE